MTDQNHGNKGHSGNEGTDTALVTTKKKRCLSLQNHEGKKNGSANWRKMVKELNEKLQALQEKYTQLKQSHEELEKCGLGTREATQLRRLKHLHNSVVNIQVCPDCKVSFDNLLKDASHLK